MPVFVMKLLSLFFAGLLVAYGCAKLWLVPANAVPDSDWCRHWFCETDLETQHEYQEYLQASIQQAPKTVPGFAEILRRDPASRSPFRGNLTPRCKFLLSDQRHSTGHALQPGHPQPNPRL